MSHPDSPYHPLSRKSLPGAATNEGWGEARRMGAAGTEWQGKSYPQMSP